MMQNAAPRVVIFGATSAIAQATAQIYAGRGARLFLIARNAPHLESVASDLRVRGASVTIGVTDLDDLSRHQGLIDSAIAALGGIDVAMIAYGVLPDQPACQQSVAATLAAMHTNALSAIGLMTVLAVRLEKQGSGTLAVISSVAGDRGRKSNYVYGAAKSMLIVFTSGLRQRLQSSGVNVLTIKPGFVDTPMTAAFRKGLLWASPQQIARGIVSAIDRRRSVVYLPWFWRGIMFVIRGIPESIFRRLTL